MSRKILLVDFENAPSAIDGSIPDDVTVRVFLGASQTKISTDLHVLSHSHQGTYLPTRIGGNGKNALDFHIAFYLGEHLREDPGAECLILSKDKGFDPLVKHLTSRGLSVRRVTSLTDAFPVTKAAAKQAAAQTVGIGQVKNLLINIEESKRPKRRAGLIAYVASHFPKQNLTKEAATALVGKLIADGHIAEVGGKLAYDL